MKIVYAEVNARQTDKLDLVMAIVYLSTNY